MFSQKIYVEIARLTQKALEELHSRKTIDQVTIILGDVHVLAEYYAL